tara:strand:- start:43 stop:513 length:471 start_codon:yes stop_codon:yes gene_type:complete
MLVLLRTTFPHSFTVHPSVLVSFFSPFFWLVAIELFVGCFGSPAVDAVNFCRMTLNSPAGRFFPNVSADPIGLIYVLVNPALLLLILRTVVMLDSSQVNFLRGGDAERPVPGQADSSTSPQRLPGLMSPCGPAVCTPLGSGWTPAAAAQDCVHAPG